MANSLTQLYRRFLAETGQKDDRDDYFITQELGEWAQRERPGLFQEFPDFGTEWGTIREANAPSLPAEVGRAAKRAAIGLGATAAGAVGLFTGSDYFKRKASELEGMASAPELAATVPTMEDIAPGETGVSRVLDRDTVRYGLSKVGEAAPSIAESLVTAGVGAAVGSAAAPGPGTIAGAGAGLLGRAGVKAAIRSLLSRQGAKSVAEQLVERGVIKEATEEAIEEAVKAGAKPVVDLVTSNARRIGALRGGQTAGLANAYGLSAGEIYNETDDRGLALGLGAVAAIPDTILPSYLLRRMFPAVGIGAAREQGKNLVTRIAREALATTGIEATTEGFQESVNIVARNLKEGRDPLEFSDDDWKRVREAAVTGAAGGALVTPLAVSGGNQPSVSIPDPAAAVQPPSAVRPTPVPTPTLAAAPSVASGSVITRVARMTPEERVARLTELDQKTRTPVEEREYQAILLRSRTDGPATADKPLVSTDILPEELNAGAPVVPPVAAPVSAPYVPPLASTPGVPAPTELDIITNPPVPDSLAEGMVGAQPGEILARRMVGTVPMENAAVPTIPSVTAPIVSNAPVAEPPAVATPAASVVAAPSEPIFQYTIQRTQENIPGFVQVDRLEGGESVASGNVESFRAEGFDLPAPPDSLPQGRYTLQQVRDEIAKQKVPSGAVSAAANAVLAPEAVLGNSDRVIVNTPIGPRRVSVSTRTEDGAVKIKWIKLHDDSTGLYEQFPAPDNSFPSHEAAESTGIQLAQRTFQPSQSQSQTQLPEPPSFRTGPIPAVEATRTREFQTVMGRLVANGADVQALTQELFEQGSGDRIQQQLQTLDQQLQSATPAQQASIQRQISVRRERLQMLEGAKGESFGPWQISIAMSDIANASLDNLVTLIHEAVHSLESRTNPAVQGAIYRAIQKTSREMTEAMRKAAESGGASVASVPNPSELLAENLAQQIAAEGVPEAPSIAQAIVRFLRDIYYRAAMALQRAFGAEPSPEMALRWFENQLRRELGGDFDYAFASLLDDLLPRSNEDVAAGFTGKDTPGGIIDFFDPVQQKVRQPWVEPTSDEALAWNAKFQTASTPDEGIPADEAADRQMAAAYYEEIRWLQEQHRKLAPDSDFVQFVRLYGRGAKSPIDMLNSLEERRAGVSTARIGGDGMTDAMNKMSARQALTFFYGLREKYIDRVATQKRVIEESESLFTDLAKEVNRLEANVRNADMHETELREKVKKIVAETQRSFRSGLNTSNKLGQLILTEEGLLAKDPMPPFYDQVFNALSNAQVPLFEYVEAIALLDLSLEKMEAADVWKAIKENASGSPALTALSKNKPLALTLAVMAVRNARQMDQIQLRRAAGPVFVDIHQELENIRNATEAQVRVMIDAIDEKAEAKGLKQRIRLAYLKDRKKLQRLSDRISRAEEQVGIMESAMPALDAEISTMEQAMGGVFSDWTPFDGAKYTAMRLNPDGSFRPAERELKFNPDGTAAESERIQSDIAETRRWLEANQNLRGTKRYNTIERQIYELGLLDVQRAYPAANFGKIIGAIDSLVRPIQAIARQAGTAAGARINQQFNKFGLVMRQDDRLQVMSRRWANTMQSVQASSGIRDHGQFLSQVYNPVMYFLGVNPGLNEAQAIRQATREARRRLGSEPTADFSERFERFLRATKEVNDRLLQIAEDNGVFVSDPQLGESLRRALSRGWITGMRGMDNATVFTLIQDMKKAGWNIDGTFSEILPENGADWEQLENTEALGSVLKNYFTPRVVEGWLLPFINKPGEPVFNYAGTPISQIELQDAWAQSNGDVLNWIDVLGNSIGISAEGDASPAATFRAEMLKQLDGLYSWEAKMAYENNQTPDLFNQQGPKPHVIMDARVNDLLPPEHIRFAAYDPTSSRQMLGQLAFHGSFGRNGSALIANIRELENNLKLKKAEFDSLTSTRTSDRILEAKARGLDYDELKNGAARYHDVMEFKSKAEAALGIRSIYGPMHDARAGLELIGFMVGQAVDNPKTASLNLTSLAARPFAMHSSGPLATKATLRSYAEFLKNGFGGVLNDFGINLVRASDFARETGEVEGKAFRDLTFGEAISDIGKEGEFQEGVMNNWVIRPLRAIRAIQKKGVGVGPLGVPGLGAMSRFATEAAIANTRGNIWLLQQVINRGIEHFAAHPEDLNNPTFRFTPQALKLSRFDHGAFNWMRDRAVEYGMGPIEQIVRDAIPRQQRGERTVTKDQVVRLAQMTAAELDGQASINTAPSGLASNPALQYAIPLLRWPLWMMHTAHKGLADADGRVSFKSMMKGLGTLAAWNLPVGLAFTFMLDEYDEKILGKKNALPAAEGVGAIPGVGPALALATTDRTIPQELMAMGQRMARAGNVYGLGSDLANLFIAPFDPASGQRVFSLDQRVLVMSQLMNMAQAARNYMAQDAATWGTVWRPLVASVGGNGALHSLDIVNQIAGLDNAESRLQMRINAQRWINAAAREVGVETKGATSFGTPTPLSVWTREMQLAAMANDRAGFMDSYQRALKAARGAVMADSDIPLDRREREAQNRVLRSWRTRHPLSSLVEPPTDVQLRQMFEVMSDQGREDVENAIRLFRSYSQFIEPTQEDRWIRRQQQSMRPPSAESMRRQMAGSLVGF